MHRVVASPSSNELERRDRRGPDRSAAPIRRSLLVGRSDDPAEREADRVADAVMATLRAPAPEAESGGPRIARSANIDGAQRSTSSPVVLPDRPPMSVARIRRRPATTIGLEGGMTDAATTDLIERARGRGATLPDRVQRTMAGAFGADFSGVRVHHDAAAHHVSARLGTRAFTTGSDVFFGRSAYRPSSPDGQRLIAHELSHVLQNGGPGPARRVVRRNVTYGQNPAAVIQPTDKDLLYGINIPRGKTKGGLSTAQRDIIRTIDDYNRAIGINSIMTSKNSAIGLYDVHEQLESAAPWGLPYDAALNTAANAANIQLWIGYLRQHEAKIGLKDLGDSGGFLRTAKIKKKGRFKKNRAESQAAAPKADRLTATDTRKFLSPSNDKQAATLAYNAMSAAKQEALNKWVYRAFFRRTSKLGQDFTVKVLNAKIHFNTVADPDFQQYIGPQWQDRGLETMEQSGQNAKNRSITVSELRHMRKLAQQYPGQFNVYGEI